MPSVRLQLNISASEFLAWYRGTARSVLARADSGQWVEFPASALQKFIHSEGIHGRFVLTYDDNHKFISLEQEKASSGLDEMLY